MSVTRTTHAVSTGTINLASVSQTRKEQKAAKTLSAILLAFIITWTPYNVFAIVQTFCADCIHQHLYEFGRSLCRLVIPRRPAVACVDG